MSTATEIAHRHIATMTADDLATLDRHDDWTSPECRRILADVDREMVAAGIDHDEATRAILGEMTVA